MLDSFRDQFYAKALECVKVLREEAIKVREWLENDPVSCRILIKIHESCSLSEIVKLYLKSLGVSVSSAMIRMYPVES